jgi:hypothetical protein
MEITCVCQIHVLKKVFSKGCNNFQFHDTSFKSTGFEICAMVVTKSFIFYNITGLRGIVSQKTYFLCEVFKCKHANDIEDYYVL